jgi:hypothetical protein
VLSREDTDSGQGTVNEFAHSRAPVTGLYAFRAAELKSTGVTTLRERATCFRVPFDVRTGREP